MADEADRIYCSPILDWPQDLDDCVLLEERLFIQARDLSMRLYTLAHELLALEQDHPELKKHRKRAEKLARRAVHRAIKRKVQLTRARMWTGNFGRTRRQTNESS